MSKEQLVNEYSGEGERTANSMKGYNHARFNNSMEYTKLLRVGARYYDDMRELRRKWKRDLDYYMGRQLEDTVIYNGHSMTVKRYMELKGLPALSNDIITDKMVTLKGLVRQEYLSASVRSVDTGEEEVVQLFNVFLRQNDNNNEMSEFAASMFEEHAAMGFIAAKPGWYFREGREDVYIDQVDPFMLALPAFRKKDLSDIDFIAEMHDLSWAEILSQFYKKDGDEEKLNQIFAAAVSTRYHEGYADTGMNQTERTGDFYHSNTAGKYRVIEIWTKERNRALWYHDRLNGTCGFRPLSEKADIDAENEKRKQDNIIMDEWGQPLLDIEGKARTYVPEDQLQLIEYEKRIEEMWYYRMLSPNGYLLAEGRSPYRVLRDGYSFYMHPYVFLAYPCIQGEVRSFIDRLIDKQRQYNHDNILIDFVIMNSSKGVLAIDKESLTEDQDIDDIAEEYVKVDGTILYTSKKGGNVPQQIQNKSLPAGIEFLIKRDEAMITAQSGVQPSLQGVHHNTSGKQYQIEKESSATAVTDYVSSFNSFRLRLAKKQLYMIQQYYDSHRSVMIAGEDFCSYYNPETMGDIAFDMAMSLDANSATLREGMKDFVWNVYLRDEIDLGQALDSADFGDTNRLKRSWMQHKQDKMLAQQQAQMAQMGGNATVPGTQQQLATGTENVNAERGATHLLTPEQTGRSTSVGTTGASASA